MDDETRRRLTNLVIKQSDLLTYCRNLGWTTVGHDVSFIAHDDDTVKVAILARDHRGIDLNNGEARFSSLGARPGQRRNESRPCNAL